MPFLPSPPHYIKQYRKPCCGEGGGVGETHFPLSSSSRGLPEGSVQMFEESHVFPRMGPKEFRNGCGDGHRTNTSGVKHDTGQAWALDPAAWGSVRALQFTSSETSGKLLHFWASVSPSGKWHLIWSLRGLNVFVCVKERA